MIDTLFFLLQLAVLATLLGWACLNDQVEDGAPTRGPLAYKIRKRRRPR